MDLNCRVTLEVGWFDERNATLAKLHEEGGGRIPSRTHLYKVVNSPDFWEFVNTDYIRKAVQENPLKGFDLIGKLFLKYYKYMVLTRQITPPLMKTTIYRKRQKGSKYPSTPLIDTMQLLNSITYKVYDNAS